jgi:Raf kinase inhibitor-like YbhB/YbcL family protein
MFRTYANCVMAFLIFALFFEVVACSRPEGVNSNKEQTPMKLEISSGEFKEGESMPLKYTCDGEDTSPSLNWKGIPESAKSLALICDDPDAPVGTWVHWALYDLPPNVTELPEAIPTSATTPQGATQGTNDFKRIGYGGPCPPEGKPHRYFFKLYALDVKLNLKPGATKAELVSSMNGHILAEGLLMGTYKRK